jgi:folate-binding protein YgfZ
MAQPTYALNDARACLAISGEDRRTFLQGLVSNDVAKVGPGRAIYAALLTGQGRFLHDLMIACNPADAALLLDGEALRLDDLMRRLSMYKLRAKVALADVRDELAVAVMWGEVAAAALGLPLTPGAARAWGGGIVFVDPRLAGLGCRGILPREAAAATLEGAGFTAAPLAEHRRLRLSLGVPEGSLDLPPEKALPLENGFDELNGVDFTKGCYVGQELTARMKHRALVKKRLVPVAIEGPAPAPDAPVTLAGQEAGELRTVQMSSDRGGVGLALLKIEIIDAATASGASLAAGPARLKLLKPAWLG